VTRAIFTATELRAKILALLAERGPISGRDIRRALGGRPPRVIAAMHMLEAAGEIQRSGSGRTTRWSLVERER
jgi:DNA-binding MarR family transcriptional regulator